MKQSRKCKPLPTKVIHIELKFYSFFYSLVAHSFNTKGDITKHFKISNRYDELVELQQKSWQGYVDEAVSFIVKDKGGRIVGVCINKEYHFDPSDGCECSLPPGLSADIHALSDFLFNQIK